jgi:hypothetical protein
MHDNPESGSPRTMRVKAREAQERGSHPYAGGFSCARRCRLMMRGI